MTTFEDQLFTSSVQRFNELTKGDIAQNCGFPLQNRCKTQRHNKTKGKMDYSWGNEKRTG